MAENFIPSTATQTIGTPTKRWNNIYSTKIKTNDTFVNDRIGAGALGRHPYSIYKARNNP